MTDAKSTTERPASKIRLVCVSDTHNHAPGEGYKLPAGDILIHAGDLTNQGSLEEIRKAAKWLESAQHPVKIVVAGNHDLSLDGNYSLKNAQGWNVMPTQQQQCRDLIRNIPGVIYLEHEKVDVSMNGIVLSIFGSPYSVDRGTQNWAFQYDQADGAKLWSEVPDMVDILITHTPPRGILDESKHWPDGGCQALLDTLKRARPRVHVCGHHHEGRGAVLVEWSNDQKMQPEVHVWLDPGASGKKQSLLTLLPKPGAANNADGAIVNASIMSSSWSASGHKGFNKPIVVDIPATSRSSEESSKCIS